MALLIHANEATAAKRRAYFHLVDATDGMTPETGEAGGQPEISTDGAAWTGVGIGVLVDIGNGRYYAELTQASVATAGDVIQTRYKSANTAECPGDTLQIVGIDPSTSLVGPGAISWPVIITEDDLLTPIEGAAAWITTDLLGTNVIAGTLYTDALGEAGFMLDAGTYYLWRQRSGYSFTNPIAITVS